MNITFTFTEKNVIEQPFFKHFQTLASFHVKLNEQFFSASSIPPAGFAEVRTTLNMFLRSPSTLLHWSLEIITKIRWKFFQRHILPDYTKCLKKYPPAHSASSKVGPPRLYPLISGGWNIIFAV